MDRLNAPPTDPRNPNNRLHLNFGYSDRNVNNLGGADAGRAYPTTPSTFPQPVFPNSGPNGQPEVWGGQSQTPSSYAGGPPSYFMSHVNYQAPQGATGGGGGGGGGWNGGEQGGGWPASPNMQQPQGVSSPGPYRPPGAVAAAAGYHDSTNGLINQFSNQNLGSSGQRSASPYGRQQSPAGSRPRNTGAPQGSQYGSHLAPSGLSQNGSMSQYEELPSRDAEKYGVNVFRRGQVSGGLVAAFFRDSVQRAKDRNLRAMELDKIIAEPSIEERKKQSRRNALRKGEAQYLRFLRTKERPENFTVLKIIGKGAFGEVKLVKKKQDDKIYALKSLVKTEMFRRDQLAHVRAERDILAEADSPWVVKLHTTFQDNAFLYMLMEFLPGGDLMTMLIKYEIFSEDITRFYMAELTLALETVHSLGFIHRDIKPDNILLDRSGHIKLTDFGLSTGFHKEHDQSYYQQLMNGKPTKSSSTNRNSVTLDQIQLTVSNRAQINTWRKSRRQLAYSTVGTPDYIAPEIFTGRGYDHSCDWWSVGTIMFECMIGWPPFCADESTETYRKIVDWPRHLHFPPDQRLRPEAESFIRSLICERSERIGTASVPPGAGANEVKAHPFFAGVDWSMLRRIRAPFEPKLNSAVDTQYFPVDEIPQQDTSAAIRARDEAAAKGQEGGDMEAEMSLPFVGYTYKRFENLRG